MIKGSVETLVLKIVNFGQITLTEKLQARMSGMSCTVLVNDWRNLFFTDLYRLVEKGCKTCPQTSYSKISRKSDMFNVRDCSQSCSLEEEITSIIY